jgi:hypothetical protein
MAKHVQVVFLTTVSGVAQAGDMKTVSGGFWRNYLAPRSLAVLPRDKRAKRFLARKETASAPARAVSDDETVSAPPTQATPDKRAGGGRKDASADKKQLSTRATRSKTADKHARLKVKRSASRRKEK